MPHPLDGARAKLARADEHLDALDRAVLQAIEPHADRLRFEVRQDGDWYVMTTEPIPVEFPLRLSAICGDAVQNLRSALDYVVFELVSAAGEKPSRYNAFPIYTRRRDFDNRVVHPNQPKRSPLYGLDPKGEPWTIIEAAQPFHASRLRDAMFSRLAALSGLSNRDKHHALPIQKTFADVDRVEQAIGWSPDAILLERTEIPQPISFKKRTEVTRLRFDPAGPEPKVYVQGEFPLIPSFGDERCQAPVGALRDIAARVTDLVGQFDKFF